MRILVVEDDFKIATFIKKGLIEESYKVDVADDGEEALILSTSNNYDIILLDIMIPFVNGIDICKSLREGGLTTPIILLTARDTLDDKIKGLDSGANDYLTKPFELKELYARIRAQLRVKYQTNDEIGIKDLSINITLREVTREGKRIELTSKEYVLLELLAKNKNKLVSEEMIFDKLKDFEQSAMSNVISVYIYRLRNKLNKNAQVKLIRTVRGAGYKLMDTDV